MRFTLIIMTYLLAILITGPVLADAKHSAKQMDMEAMMEAYKN